MRGVDCFAVFAAGILVGCFAIAARSLHNVDTSSEVDLADWREFDRTLTGENRMLILTRKPGDAIVLFDAETGIEIVLTVTKTQRGQCDIGIQAPPRIVIERREIRDGGK